jgi:hypothetical protein
LIDQPEADDLRRQSLGAALVGAGGALLVISPFLQWISVVGIVNINLPQLLDIAGYRGDLGYIVSAIGAVILLGAIALYADGANTAGLGIGSAIIVGLVGVPGTVRLIHVAQQSHGVVTIGPGVVAAGLAELFLLIGGLATPHRSK